MSFNKIRTRIAPSPTGFMHIATLWIGLYNYFFAKKHGGKFILRIEDTDRERFVDGSFDDILENFEWAGINFDEGPLKNNKEIGDFGPYIQSKRLDIYKKYVEELLTQKKAYWCDCSNERLKEIREKQIAKDFFRGYDGYCRDRNLLEGSVVRLKVPQNGSTSFIDLIRDKISIENNKIDDQILLKSDGFPTYHLASVVDDHLMQISHVIRGEEWISSTPKHILLYSAFGWEIPQFAHLPLLLNKDRSKLSKRNGDTAVSDFRKKGYLASAMINFLALQGWNPSGNREVYSMNELISFFDISKINKSGSVVNLEKLDWLNGYYIRQTNNKELGKLLLNYLPDGTNINLSEKVAELTRERLIRLSDVNILSSFIFKLEDFDSSILVWKKSTIEKTLKILEELKNYFATLNSVTFSSSAEIQKNLTNWILDRKYSNGEVLWPLRVALSGLEQSPPPFEIASILGKVEVIRRLDFSLKKLI